MELAAPTEQKTGRREADHRPLASGSTQPALALALVAELETRAAAVVLFAPKPQDCEAPQLPTCAAGDLASLVVASAPVAPVELAAPTERVAGHLLRKADRSPLTSESSQLPQLPTCTTHRILQGLFQSRRPCWITAWVSQNVLSPNGYI